MPRRDISVEALRHKDKRRNIPTAELESVMDDKDKTPIRLAYERRNRDLDPSSSGAARTSRTGPT
jgi:adenine-specific DNA-methyltransferase